MDAIAAAQQRAIDVEEVRVLRVPHESLGNRYLGIPGLFLSRIRHDEEMRQPWRRVERIVLNTGRSLRGGRLRLARTSARLNPSSAIARLSVFRCIPSSSAALHWLPRFAINTSRRY